MDLKILVEEFSKTRLPSTLILLLLLFIVRALLHRRIQRIKTDDPIEHQRWNATARNVLLALLAAGLVLIWAEQLRTFAVSVVAIAAAIVIATKELILCVSGYVLKTASKGFHIGDRIEVNGLRGDVIDHRVLSTTILEIGPGTTSHQHTGRAIVLPNSIFVSSAVINETYTDEYVLHIFTVPVAEDSDWQAAERRLLEAARIECAPYLEQAKHHMEVLQRQHGLVPMTIDPRVMLQMPEPDRINLLLRIPVPARRKGRIEQQILRRYLKGAAQADTPLPTPLPPA
ncbi:MAG: hypothetical protein PWP23_2847 [Candidatus Sumerlaeota bacterium]|nr:hypothetical protein [Candidatus Sumerlaeota bacterium]